MISLVNRVGRVCSGRGRLTRLLVASSLAVAALAPCSTASAQNCPCDWNTDGIVNSQDLFDFLTGFFANNADINQDGITNSQDFFDMIACLFDPPAACVQPVITGIFPPAAGPGEVIRIEGRGFGDKTRPEDLCIAALPPNGGFVHFTALEVHDDFILARTLEQVPGLQAGPLVVGFGQGNFDQIFVEGWSIPAPVWGGAFIPNGRAAVQANGVWTPIPQAPGPGEYVFHGGPVSSTPGGCPDQCCIDIVLPTGTTFPVGTKMQILARMWGVAPCPLFDGHVPCMTSTVPKNVTGLTADICNAVLSAYAQAGIVNVSCTNTPIPGGRRLCLQLFDANGNLCCLSRCDFSVFISPDILCN